MNRRTLVPAIAILAPLTVPGAASAQSMGGHYGDFYGGILYPLLALEHLLSIIALSLFVGQHGPKLARACLVAFPTGLLIGAIVASTSSPSPFVATFNLASLVILGVLVAGSIRQPWPGLIGLAIIFGFSHGYESDLAVASNTTVCVFAAGAAITGLFFTAIPAAIVVSLRHKWQRMIVRVIGFCIALLGGLMIAIS